MNVEFCELTPKDFKKVSPCLEEMPFVDTGFCGLYYIGAEFDTRYAFFGETLCLRYFAQNELYYVLPEIPKTEKLTQIAKSLCQNGHVNFDFVREVDIGKFTELNGFSAEIKQDDIYSDYICTFSDYTTLDKAASLHKYKDYNQFRKRFAHQVFELNVENLGVAARILEKWCEGRDCSACTYGCEKKWLNRLFNSWEELPIKGLLVYIGSAAAAFCVAEQNGQTVLKLAGKSIGNQVGLHVFMNIESVKRLFPNAETVNLGPDSGVPGIIRFKKKFKPYTILKKYSVRLVGNDPRVVPIN